MIINENKDKWWVQKIIEKWKFNNFSIVHRHIFKRLSTSCKLKILDLVNIKKKDMSVKPTISYYLLDKSGSSKHDHIKNKMKCIWSKGKWTVIKKCLQEVGIHQKTLWKVLEKLHKWKDTKNRSFEKLI